MLMFRKEVGAERTTAVSHSKIAHPQHTDSSITFNIPWESSLHHPRQVLVAGLCLPVSEILMWGKIWLSGIIPSIRSLVKGHRPLAFLHQSYYCLTAASLLLYGRNTTPLDTWKSCSSFLCAWSWWAGCSLGALFLFSAKTHVSGGPMTCVPVPTVTPLATATHVTQSPLQTSAGRLWDIFPQLLRLQPLCRNAQSLVSRTPRTETCNCTQTCLAVAQQQKLHLTPQQAEITWGGRAAEGLAARKTV